MRKELLFAVVFSFSFFLLHNSLQAITLEEAIDIALKNNLRILLAEEKVKEAQHRIKGAVAEFFPSLRLNGTYTHFGEVPSISIPYIGELEMGEQDTTSFSFSLTQPVYTSGKLSLAYQQANLNYQKTEEDLSAVKKDLIFQVKESFYSVLLARENLKIAEQALNQAELHLKMVESFYQSGRASRFDLLRAKVEVANLKPNLIQARNNLNMAKERLASILSISSSSLEIEGKLKFEPLHLTLNEAIDIALNNRSDLKSVLLNMKMAMFSLKIARYRNLPVLSLTGNYEFTSPGEANTDWEKNWSISLVFSFPFFDSGRTKAIIEQEKSRLEQVKLMVNQLEDTITLEVKKAFWDMQAARETLFAQEKNVQQAEEALSIAEGRYRNGTITQIEVLDANLALTRAKLNYSKALYDYNLAKAALIKAMGKLED